MPHHLKLPIKQISALVHIFSDLFPRTSLCLATALLFVGCSPDIGAQDEKGLSIASNGVTDHTIVVPPETVSISSERFAAKELRHFFEKITGAEFSIVEEGSAHEGPGIYVGATDRAARLGIDAEKLGEEEWVLRTEGEDLVLSGGRPRGTLYAVYELLQGHAGCRWLSHEIEVIPENPNLSIPPLQVRGEPAFSWRQTSLYQRHDAGISKEDYALFLVRNRYNGSAFWLDNPEFGFAKQFGSPLHRQGHSLFHYQAAWEEVKPDYFAMLEDGTRAPRPTGGAGAELSLTNPEVRDRVYESLVGYIEEDRRVAAETGRPAPTIYPISQNDTARLYCRSPEAMDLAEREGSYSAVILDFANAIGERIEKQYPEIKLMVFAYQYSKFPPKTIRPRSNVIVQLALLDFEYRNDELADVLRPLTAPTNADALALTKAWAELAGGGQMFIWDYAMALRTPFRHPYDGTAKITQNLELWHRLGIQRVFMESAAIDISFMQLRDWLFFQKSVDPALDTSTLVDEFLAGFFGPAAPQMREYHDLLVESTVAGDKPFFETPPSVNPYLTPEFFTRVNALLDEAETRCSGTDHAKQLRNVRYERVPVDSALLHLWHQFASHSDFEGRKEEILDRYERNKGLLIENWASTVHHVVNYGGATFAHELASLRIEPPARFAGRNVNTRLMANQLLGISRDDRIDDPDAAAGRSQRFGRGKPEDHKLPFQARVHDSVTGESWDMLTLESVPQDEAYHWYQVGTVPLTPSSGLWSNIPIWIPLGWASVPPPNNEVEIWLSLKFTGPTYVEGSTQPDQVLIDRIVIVPPEEL